MSHIYPLLGFPQLSETYSQNFHILINLALKREYQGPQTPSPVQVFQWKSNVHLHLYIYLQLEASEEHKISNQIVRT